MDFRPTYRARTVVLALAGLLPVFSWLTGCEVQSYIDPSKTGYFQHTPITMPILERVDVIERGEQDQWEAAEEPTPADLVPSTLEYRLAAGDFITVEILELQTQFGPTQAARQIDPSGNVRLPPPLRDFPASGKTLRELEDDIADYLESQRIIIDPQVTIYLNQGAAFQYTITGSVFRPGNYSIVKPDLRLHEALGNAGGVPPSVEHILVIRSLELGEREAPVSNPDEMNGEEPPPNLEDILDQLDDDQTGGGSGDGGVSPASAILMEREIDLGAISQDTPEFVDIDDLYEPRRIAEYPGESFRPAGLQPRASALSNTQYRYSEEAGRWIAFDPQDDEGQEGVADDVLPADAVQYVTRIIRIPYDALLTNASYNIIIRPGDHIYVLPPLQGVVYIGGEVARTGVYSLPPIGQLTLSRAIDAAGGLNAIAIPNRVDVIRRIGDNREAVLRMNLAAIRKRNEPDIFLKPDDHIIVGTNFIASPLAVIRNGFRATYGFGFLLDRNFGNDVFGAPPTNRGGF
jgi:protein involved in polysaccharide export with SLBB domain